MSARAAATLVLAWVSALSPVTAFAQEERSVIDILPLNPCGHYAARGMPEGPISLGFADADLGVGRRVCMRTEVTLGGRGGAVIDTPDFYGAIGALGQVGGSFALAPHTEVFATLDAVRYQWVTNAVIVEDELTLGQLSVGATHRTSHSSGLLGAASARFLLPTGFASPGVRVVGAEVGHGFGWHPSTLSRLRLHAWGAVDVTAGLSRAAALPRVGGALLLGAQYNPWRTVGFALDVTGRAGWTTSVAPALAVRFGTDGGFGGELAVTRSLFGTDRHAALLGLRLGYRL